MNARSICNKIPELQATLDVYDPDIFCVSETWLSDDFPDSNFQLNNYNIFRHDRDGGRDPHGGVMIGVKCDLNPVLVKNETNHEIVIIKLRANDVPLHVVTAYRPPQQNLAENTTFVESLKEMLESCSNLLMVGDFNYPNISWHSYTASCAYNSYFLDLINESGLHQFVQEPTRELNILDLCIASNNNMIENLKIHDNFSTSDHAYFTCEMLDYGKLEMTVKVGIIILISPIGN